MTITRETLELAAKAAGVDLRRLDWPEPDRWMPITDHGQLHDLAMACKITIDPQSNVLRYFVEDDTSLVLVQVDCQNPTALAEAVIQAAAEQQKAKGG